MAQQARGQHAFLWTLAAVLAASFTAGCSGPAQASSEQKREPKSDTPAPVARVVRQDLARELEIAAEFRPYQEIDLHAKVSGYLKSVHVDVGDSVRRGQLLAVLEVPEMVPELAHAAASLKGTEIDVERARGELRRAEAAVKIRSLSYERLANVVKVRPNLIAQQEIDDAEARLREAEAQLMAARASVAGSEEQISVAKATKARIDTMIGYQRITAPFAGVITQRRGDPGALVQAGTTSATQAMPVVRLSQVNRLRLVLPVPESVVPRVRLGSPVEIRVDSLGRVFQGKIARFSGRLDTGTRTMETEVDIPNPSGVIKPGMYGYAMLRLDRREDALAAPVQAVRGHGPGASVMVVDEDSRVQERPVEAGIETPHFVEILSGLKENDLVVVGNRKLLKPGTRVEPKMMSGISPAPGH